VIETLAHLTINQVESLFQAKMGQS
jgi:hypothetical protein